MAVVPEVVPARSPPQPGEGMQTLGACCPGMLGAQPALFRPMARTRVDLTAGSQCGAGGCGGLRPRYRARVRSRHIAPSSTAGRGVSARCRICGASST